MRSRSALLQSCSLALLPLLGACSEGGPTQERGPTPVDDGGPAPGAGEQQGSPPSADPPRAEPTPPEPAPLDPETVELRRRERVERMFGRLIGPLTEASEAYRRHDELEESRWFGEDRRDNQERIDGLLDRALEVLEVSELSDARGRMRRLEAEIAELEGRILRDREASLSAPAEADLGRLERTYTTTREDLEQRIARARADIEERRAEIGRLELRLVQELRAIGVEVDLASARSLLSSVAGDDFVRMCVVFDNVRGVTLQLQELTERSGESLEAARRYYGAYLVLIQLMDRLQRQFAGEVRGELVPRLEQYREEARELIAAARRNLRQGGSAAVAEQNIASNELTIEATGLYVDYLLEQAAAVEARNERLQVDLRDAENTYATVLLSSQVAELLRRGSRNFAALLELDVPELRGFENAELRAEFERLTRRLGGLD